MADASRSSFLGSINPWSRSNTPPPRSPRQLPKDEGLKQVSGLDHSINLRPSPSLKRYPKGCPPLKTQWYYAVDVAKRKPFAPEIPSGGKDKEASKPVVAPKKWVPFSKSDSKAIEAAFQRLDVDDTIADRQASSTPTSTKVPVNEDYLFDVNIEKRELEPAYWLGPVYEVRRGSWFTQEGSVLKPCDENLANQLEEGYLKVAPWRKSAGAPRSVSQPRNRISPTVTENPPAAAVQSPLADTSQSNTHRLFGAHMNTTATYLDSSTVYLITDDFMSRMSSTVYGRFGGQSGTKVIRGFSDAAKSVDGKPVEIGPEREERTTVKVDPEPDASEPANPRPSALERQLSSLAGLRETKSLDEEQKQEEEEAREQEEKEMEDAREKDGDDQAREIEHLVLVTHGIGQRLGLRLDSINFVHDVNTMRKTMKAVYESAPDLQALTGESKNCRIQVLPVCWRHLLDFPKQSLKQNRKEHDLGDSDLTFEEDYPSLQDITVEGVPAVRNLITDLALDVLLYQSAYREHIARIVQKEANRVFLLFKQRTGFKGKVSLCGHSLGSAILFDILCRQSDGPSTRPRRVSSRTARDGKVEEPDVRLEFLCDSFFAVGSPIALFQMLKGKTIAGRQALRDRAPPTSPFNPDSVINDPFSTSSDLSIGGRMSADSSPSNVSSPRCSEFFNIFHPTDPIAYRVEPLVSPALAHMKPQNLPYTKKGLFAAPGIANLSARVGQQVMTGWYNLTSGVASSLINRSLGITGEEQALPQDRVRAPNPTVGVAADGQVPSGQTRISDGAKQQAIADAAKAAEPGHTPTLIDSEMETLFEGFKTRRNSNGSSASTEASDTEHEQAQERARRLRREEAKVRAVNSNGRVDYAIQEGLFDVSLLASIASHLGYWADEDVSHFMIGQMLKKSRDHDRERDRDKIVL